jgi:hypothetical protein
MRDPAFTGAAGQLPDAALIRARAPLSPLEILRPPATPAEPIRVQTGREYLVDLAMP